jgi:ADP-ribose pyrophosphatase YjhB (NUDIX family)
MRTPPRFNVRVYGVCINADGELLVADERIQGMKITKLPGGGLEFGEGPADCVRREFIEETGQAVHILSHFYTTDFFVLSAFHSKNQIISIYYKVQFEESPRFAIKTLKHDFPEGTDNVFVFRWIPLDQLSPAEFNFPIDKKVAELILEGRK